jgi:hypothetical protein
MNKLQICCQPLRFVPALVFLMMISFGCAVGNKHRYHDATIHLGIVGGKTIAVTVHDQREYVVNGSKATHFVGLSRGGFGNPFNVGTVTGKPLAEDMTVAISAALKKAGFQVRPIFSSYSEEPQRIIQNLQKAGMQCLAILCIHNWKSDTYTRTALIYDVSLSIYDQDGKLLGESKIEGHDDLGGSFWNPPSHAKSTVPAAFAKKIEQIFSTPEIREILK